MYYVKRETIDGFEVTAEVGNGRSVILIADSDFDPNFISFVKFKTRNVLKGGKVITELLRLSLAAFPL